MRSELQRQIVREILDYADRGTTQLADRPFENPVTSYTSDEVFSNELQTLLRDRPLVVCLSCDIPTPGDYYVTEAGRVPLFVVRERDGSVRGFVNICRHRGAPLIPKLGRGHTTRHVTCGFHGWVYDLTGNVVGRPHAGPGFDAAIGEGCSRLLPVLVTEGSGLVFAQVSGSEITSTAQLLGDMADELEGFGFGTYSPFREWSSSWNANWKLIAETFLETYHVPALHKDTVAKHFLARPSSFVSHGLNIRFHSVQKSILGLRDVPESEWEYLPHGTVEFLVTPTTILNFSVDHLAVYRLLPQAPDRTDVLLTVYTQKPVSDDTKEHYDRTLALHERVSGDQDFAQQVAIQRSFASGVLDSVIFGRNEPAAIAFHHGLQQLLIGE